jgi:DNA-binding MarR family transcriptional regulator
MARRVLCSRASNSRPAGVTCRIGTEDSADRLAAAEAIYRLTTAAIRQQPRDISLTAASALATVERTGPRRITDLALIQGVTQPSVTALVKVLEQAGLAERRADPQDQRVVLVALTPAGADYLRRRRRAGTEALARLIDKLTPDEHRALTAATAPLRHLHELDSEEQAADRRGAALAQDPADRQER